MYTQCPECDVAFRVSADVLKQAAGKVRCGGCGVPFNALEHLSEEKPQNRTRREPEAPVAELTAELPVDPDDLAPPRAISAEQSAALLKTLDQLAGDDIRIEDTGVEWRVLDVDDDDDAPDVIDAREEPDSEPEPEQSAATEELRYDDNTPLPDDFDLDRESAHTSPPEPTAVEVSEPPHELDLSHVDLAFGDPDEWKDLLGEVVETGVAEKDADLNVEAEVETAAPDDDQPEPDVEPATDQPLDMDTQFQIQAEALGVDLSGLHESIEHEAIEEIELESPADDELAETSIDEDLIAAAFEAEATARKEVSAAEELLEELAEEDEVIASTQDADEESAVEEEPDLEVAEKPEAEELNIGAIEIELGSDEEDDVETGAPEIDEADLEAVLALAAEDASDEAVEDEISEELAIEFEEDAESASEEQSTLELAAELAAAFVDEEPAEELEQEPEEQLEAEPEEEPEEDQGTDEGHKIPAQTEEEMTINMMIDQDLLAIAVEDNDGFTSTIVQKQVSSKDDVPKEKAKSQTEDEVDDAQELKTEESLKQAKAANPLVETIIMEGESFRGEIDDEQEAAKAGFMAQAKEAFSHHVHEDEQSDSSPNIRIIAGLVLLLLLLAMQVLHQHREELATLPAFNNSITPIYRGIGQPIIPAWDISGWRIEASKGTADEDDEELTIYSRVGNTSDRALPYPLMHVALTDRFSEIIGSRVLEPAEYLVGDSDPRKTIEPGDTFNAVITVESPSPNTTGYNLNPCYRLDGGQLRCKIEDFK